MRVALVHDWLVGHRGGERVLEVLCDRFPDAELFTLVHKPGSVPASIEARRVHTSFLQKVPGIFERYRHFLPLFPTAIEAFDLGGFDLIVSSSHCVAKGVRVPPGARHLSYVHAPMRYMWDLFDDYFGPGRSSVPTRLAALAVRPYLQRWDRRTAQRVDHFVANSHHIAAKVSRFYGRSASVVHPPVELERFASLPKEGSGQGGYFLWLGAFAPYKRLDLVLEAFRILKYPLWVVGQGPDASKLVGAGAQVRHLGHVAEAAVPELYRNARALLFPGEEDFGITPVEAQAAGRPVVALARGGALETVTPATGMFFREQTVDALVATLRGFEAWEQHFSPDEARAQARKFSKARFLTEFESELEQVLGMPGPR